MYVRKIQRRNKDGSVVRYVQLATNYRADGTTRAEVLLSLGREDRLDAGSLRRLVASINRYLGDAHQDAAAPLAAEGDPLHVTASRAIGATWLLDGLWKRLGIDTALAKVLDTRRFRTDVERALFTLVANRAIAPDSKRAAVEWAGCDVVIPGAGKVAEQHAYRAMDLLVDATAQAAVQEAVFFAAANLLDLEVDVVFFDTTSTYFERDTADTADGALRRFGHSKDHRGDLPQIVIGLAVTREGIPVRCWVWPGQTSDQTVIEQVRADLRSWRLGRVVTVVDSGFSSEANLACLTRAGGHYIAGIKMREGSAKAAEALARQGRYQQVRDNLRVKEVRLDSDPNRRWVICHNPVEAERDATRRTEQLAAIEEELARIKTARAADAAAARTRAAKAGHKRAPKPPDTVHRKAECALRDHPSLGRWLKQHPATGRLSIDRAKAKAEANLDGKYLLATSDPDLTAEDVALGYKNLLEAERAFRTMKNTLNLRPVYHRIDDRIRAHVLLCWLALLLIRVAERRTATTWRTLRTELGRLHQVTLTGPAGSLRQLTEPTDTQVQIFKECGVPLPPKMDALEPATTR
ncbi:IS1634 family transposase [Streptomyces sp. NPDC005813]|uniref:IS1634 family transposase n=1 Tax=unclassified Streptomyces TaxID=2593676 RepID=UPI0033C56FEE